MSTAKEPRGPRIAAPDLPYRPADPQSYRPPIGLIGCGGITEHHLQAYSSAGYNVVALCDVSESNARQRQAEFYPDAQVCTDYRQVLRRDDIEVVDVATHPHERVEIIEAALNARKHVLSQKPFVLDLDVGQRLVDLADQQQVLLAVNQNARWAPHLAYARAAIEAGLLGEVSGVHMSVHWDHSWVKDTAFEDLRYLILYDYAIHWFDMLGCFLPGRIPLRVFASDVRSSSQSVTPPLLGQAVIEFKDAQVSLAIDGDTQYGSQDRTYIAGSQGSISSVGPGNRVQTLTLYTENGFAQPQLEGAWFPDGFHGTMGELLCAIEEGRQPSHSAAGNLESLALCFAAAASAARHEPVVPGSVRRLTQ